MRLGALALVLFVLCLSVVPAHADTVYTYTGDYFGTFVYNGQPRVAGVYTTADRITGSFTVADGFVPGFTSGGATFTGFGVLPTANGDYSPSTFMDGVLSYSFSDGHQTLTKANSTAAFYLEVPDHYDLSAWGAGFRPGLWSIGITASTGGIASYLLGDRYDSAGLDADNWGLNGQSVNPSDGSHIGTWTAQTVPEPMSLLLALAGIAGLFGARRFYRS